MERNLELVREILLAVESMPYTGRRRSSDLHQIEVPGRSPEEVRYHVALLAEAGLINAVDIGNQAIEKFVPFRLTWDGHEFLDAARDDSRWNQVLAKAGSLGFAVIKGLLIEATKATVGLPAG